MNEIALCGGHIPSMTKQQIEKVKLLESVTRSMPQTPIPTHHVIHAGAYTRTIMIPKGIVLTGGVVNVSTTLILSGDATVYIGSDTIRLTGYNVITASAGRKQAFVAHEDTYLTMTRSTLATSVSVAEDEMVEESHLLMSRKKDAENIIIITGE